MTKARDISKLLSTANGKIAGANLDVSFENIADTGTEGTKVASGTTAQRGSTAGQLRFNSQTGLAEYYNGSNFKSIDTPPIISSVDVTNVQTELGGTQTFVITGSNFNSGVTIKFRDNSGTLITPDTSTLDSSTQITVTKTRSSFSNANEPYDLIATNTSGLQGTLDNGINVDNTPAFNTASGTLATINDADSGNHATVSATDPDGDTISYSVSDGALPSGVTINSSTGVISGNPTDVASQTTYNFDIKATGSSLFSTRSFNLIVNPSPDGASSARVATSANAIKTLTGTTTNGDYWITLNGSPAQVYCDMNGTYTNDSSNGYMCYQSFGSGSPFTNAINGANLSTQAQLASLNYFFQSNDGDPNTGQNGYFGANVQGIGGGFWWFGDSGYYGNFGLATAYFNTKGLTLDTIAVGWNGQIYSGASLVINGATVANTPDRTSSYLISVDIYNGAFNPSGGSPAIELSESTGINQIYYIFVK
jgi:hypothetical protein